MASTRLIEIAGRRQTGKTQEMVWFAAGAIMAGAHPAIVARNVRDASQVRTQLTEALRRCGDTEASSHAREAVISIVDTEAVRGRDLVIREVDLD